MTSRAGARATTKGISGAVLLLAGAFGLLACADGRALVGQRGADRDAGVPRDGGSDGAADGVDAAAPDAAAPDGDAPEAAPVDELLGLSLPEGVAPPRRLLDGTATLTGAGRTACSHAAPASGDGHRWCAFRLPGAAAGSTELWVMDVSAAAAGAPLLCNGQDPACVRLTKTLWAPYGNDFEGDTLIFYADAPAGLQPSQPFVGPVYAWRPGWLAPRTLASQALVCSGNAAAAVAVCLDDPRGDPNNPKDVILRVGFLADVAGPSLTALPGRWSLPGDGSVPWQLGFAPDGQTFAISTRDLDAATPFTESLFAIAVRDVSKGLSPTKIVTDVEPWTISNDGKKVFFFRGQKPNAALLSADFPTGGHELPLATNIVDFLPLGRGVADTALLLRVRLAAGGHAFQLLRDREHPETAFTVFTNQGGLEGILVSPDLRYTAWVDPSFRARSIRVSDLATCELNPSPAPEASDLSFLDDASALLWSEPRPGFGGARDGLFASPELCAPQTRFARGLGFLSPVGARGIVFGDARDDSGRSVTLKYAPAPLGDVAAAGGYRVHANVTAPVTLVSGATGPSSLHVVFRAENDGAKDSGLYLFGPVPF
jgi:hypothetical protein